MEERKIKLLSSIIEEHIATAEPVGSNLLVGKYRLKISSATARNEMMELEKDGYIYQPHTSAGRIPTEKGYKFYVSNFLNKGGIEGNIKNDLKELAKEDSANEIKIKNIAKSLAQESKEAMIIAFEEMNIYYTGISNLISQPEFYEYNLILELSEIIDHLDQIINKCYNLKLDENVKILIGSDNPIDKSCSSIMAKIKQSNRDVLMLMLGPMRMDYNKNVGLIEYAKELLSNKAIT